MVTLRSSDGGQFEVEDRVAVQSLTINHAMEHPHEGEAIPLPAVSSMILAQVIVYCERHAEDRVGDEDLMDWDAAFVRVHWDTRFGLIMAANYLNIQSLLDLICQAVADRIRNARTTEEICEILKIQNDFTPEEEEEARREREWAFE